jgi:hypothetical protein
MEHPISSDGIAERRLCERCLNTGRLRRPTADVPPSSIFGNPRSARCWRIPKAPNVNTPSGNAPKPSDGALTKSASLIKIEGNRAPPPRIAQDCKNSGRK